MNPIRQVYAPFISKKGYFEKNIVNAIFFLAKLLLNRTIRLKFAKIRTYKGR